MATTTKKTTTASRAAAAKTTAAKAVSNDVVTENEAVVETVKTPRKYEQTDLILCRSVTPGWMAAYGKSGMQYIFSNYGDECEIEYGDLYALKNARSRYLYDPLFVIEDEELLDNPRWKDIAEFYSEKVYGMDDIDHVLNLPNNKFKSSLSELPRGLAKAIAVEVAKRIENGSFDSLKKVKVIDEVCGTDFWTLMTGNDD